MKYLLIIATLLTCTLHARELVIVPAKVDASFRGLSVVNNKTAWVSGTHGTVGLTTDGGKTWQWKQVKGYEKSDFRSIYGFGKRIAVIASAGTPAVVLRTTDGGNSWALVYQDNDTSAFFDGVDFRNKNEGILYGDPREGKLQLLRTTDGGKTLAAIADNNFPHLVDGEASFAASGTCIRYLKSGRVLIATGGRLSHLQWSDDGGAKWQQIKTPIIQGTQTTGIFSMAFRNNDEGVIVGGDYKRDTASLLNCFYTTDGGITFTKPSNATRGYRECVEYTGPETLIAAGPTGIDISTDGGINWLPFSDEKGFHVVKKSRKGRLVLVAGASGKIGIIR